LDWQQTVDGSIDLRLDDVDLVAVFDEELALAVGTKKFILAKTQSFLLQA